MTMALLMLLQGTVLWLGLWGVLWYAGYTVVRWFYSDVLELLSSEEVSFEMLLLGGAEIQEYHIIQSSVIITTGVASLVISQVAVLSAALAKKNR